MCLFFVLVGIWVGCLLDCSFFVWLKGSGIVGGLGVCVRKCVVWVVYCCGDSIGWVDVCFLFFV